MDDPYTRRKLAAGLLLTIFLLIALIGEAMRDRVMRFWLGVMLFCSVVLVVSVALLVGAKAHDHEHPDLDGWYMSLKSKEGHPCCEGPGKDATHLSEIDWDTKDGHYRVRIDGNWYDVPDEAVITEPNLDGRAIVWGYPMTEYGEDGNRHITEYHIRCFTPGAGG